MTALHNQFHDGLRVHLSAAGPFSATSHIFYGASAACGVSLQTGTRIPKLRPDLCQNCVKAADPLIVVVAAQKLATMTRVPIKLNFEVKPHQPVRRKK